MSSSKGGRLLLASGAEQQLSRCIKMQTLNNA